MADASHFSGPYTGATTFFGEELRALRIAAGLTQEELAERAGLSAAGLSALERGHRRRPRTHTVRVLVAALGLADPERQALVAVARDAASSLSVGEPRLQSGDGTPVAAGYQLGPSTPRVSVPAELTTFVGRKQQLADLTGNLSTHRLVTLTGAGGVGKTRLACEVSVRLTPSFPGGVFFVPLAGLAEPRLVLTRIAEAVGVRDDGSDTLLTSLTRSTHGERTLLVLDNFEHLLAAATIVAELLAACAELTVLITSRAPLRIYGERDVAVPPLGLPTEPCYDEDGLFHYEATRLFVERARAILPTFSVTADRATAVGKICARLDGLPLAIELAAARVKLLPPEELLARLDGPLDVLIDGPRDRPRRQQTLRNAIDWSYRLLPPEQQALFRAVAVFMGGWTVDGATAVYEATDYDTLDGLSGLMHGSLIQQIAEDGQSRFTMLEVVRDYALEQARSCGEIDSAQRRHVEYFVRLGERAVVALSGGPDHVPWLLRLHLEQDNLRAALRWCVEHAESDLGVQLAGAVWRYWYLHGSPREGSDWSRAILRLVGGASKQVLRARALNGASVLAINDQDYSVAQNMLDESLTIARTERDRRAEGAVLHNLGALAAHQGDLVRALDMLLASVRLRKATEDLGGLAVTCKFLGNVLAAEHDFSAARAWVAEALAASRALDDITGSADALGMDGVLAALSGDVNAAEELCNRALAEARQSRNSSVISWSCIDVAFVRLLRTDYPEVDRLCRESLSLHAPTGQERVRLAIVLQLLAASAAESGCTHRAMCLFGAASCAWEVSHTWYHVWHDALDVWQDRAWPMLPREDAEAAFESGRKLTQEQAIAYALGDA